jgi:hypothetical protein
MPPILGVKTKSSVLASQAGEFFDTKKNGLANRQPVFCWFETYQIAIPPLSIGYPTSTNQKHIRSFGL